MSPRSSGDGPNVGDLVHDENAGCDAVVTDMVRGQLVLRPPYGATTYQWQPIDDEQVSVLKRRGSWEATEEDRDGTARRRQGRRRRRQEAVTEGEGWTVATAEEGEVRP